MMKVDELRMNVDPKLDNTPRHDTIGGGRKDYDFDDEPFCDHGYGPSGKPGVGGGGG